MISAPVGMGVRACRRRAAGRAAAWVAAIALGLGAAPRMSVAAAPASAPPAGPASLPAPVTPASTSAPLPPLPAGHAPIVDLSRELPHVAVIGVAYGATRLGSHEIGAALDRLPGDPDTIVLGIDRWVVDHRSHVAARVSDALAIGFVALPVVYVVMEAIVAAAGRKGSEPGLVLVRDLFIVSETMLLNTVLFEMAKSSVLRPRPFTYRADLGGYAADRDAVRSFYSGHAATAFAGATSFSLLFTLKHPDAPLAAKISVWAITYLLAGTTASLRVLAGKHFWTDVAVGSLMGIVTGALVPLAHLGLSSE